MPKEFNYSDKKNELEKILNDLQSSNLDVDTAVDKYKKGLELIKQVEKYLAETKNKIIELKKTLE
jgi:exodeoxyribonuclease VII small subunit